MLLFNADAYNNNRFFKPTNARSKKGHKVKKHTYIAKHKLRYTHKIHLNSLHVHVISLRCDTNLLCQEQSWNLFSCKAYT